VILALPQGVIVWRPLAITLLLHAALLLSLTLNWVSHNEVTVKPKHIPRYIEARLIDAESLQPKKKPVKARPKSRPAQPPATATRPKPRAAAPKPAVSKPKPKPVPVVVEPVQSVGPSAEERAAMARAELSMALEAEDILLEQASDQQVTQSYIALIAGVIEDNWSRPPSARNEMEAELVIQLIPTGEVVSVTVARSSGLSAFDRSAVMAVRKAGKFPELQQLPSRVFNKNFRSLRLRFKPEDLRY
jgi:TonB family protein